MLAPPGVTSDLGAPDALQPLRDHPKPPAVVLSIPPPRRGCRHRARCGLGGVRTGRGGGDAGSRPLHRARRRAARGGGQVALVGDLPEDAPGRVSVQPVAPSANQQGAHRRLPGQGGPHLLVGFREDARAATSVSWLSEMGADPGAYLSTIAGTTATLVAIVGGLLVARFVTLDSEQQGAQQVLDDAKGRLAVAKQREQDAGRRRVCWDARDFLWNFPVIGAVLDGVTDLMELRRLGDSTALSDDELLPFVDELSREAVIAKEVLEKLIPDTYDDLSATNWDGFSRSTTGLPPTEWTILWWLVFDRIVEKRPRRPHPFGHIPALAAPFVNLAQQTDWKAIQERRRDELVASHERAGQRVEDVGSEVQRLQNERDAVVRPKGLGVGLAILGYLAVVGVLLPMVIMSRAPKELTPRLGETVLWFFLSGLVLLFGYMAFLASRLKKGRPR